MVFMLVMKAGSVAIWNTCTLWVGGVQFMFGIANYNACLSVELASVPISHVLIILHREESEVWEDSGETCSPSSYS
mgnify:CR=1 FL=1